MRIPVVSVTPCAVAEVVGWRRGFPATDPAGQDPSPLEDAVTGALFTEEIIEVATSDGGYVEYHFDDPTVEDLVTLGLLEPRGLALDLDSVIESAQMANVDVR